LNNTGQNGNTQLAGNEFAAETPPNQRLIGGGGLSNGSGNLSARSGGSSSTAISTIRQTQPGETFLHYGYAEDTAQFASGLRPGSYATNAVGLTGAEARSGLALAGQRPLPNAVYTVSPNQGTWINVTPVIRPDFNQPGGLTEFRFLYGTGPGTVSGPSPIRIK